MQFVIAKAFAGIIEQRDRHCQMHALLAQNSYDLHVRDYLEEYYISFPECSYHDADRAMLCSRWSDHYRDGIGCLYLAEERAKVRGFKYDTLHVTCREWEHLYDPSDVSRMKIGLLCVNGPFAPIDITGVDVDEISTAYGHDICNLHVERSDSRPMKVYVANWETPHITSDGPVIVIITCASSYDITVDLDAIEAKSVSVWIIGSVRVILTGAITEQAVRCTYRKVYVTLNGHHIQPIFDPSIGFGR